LPLILFARMHENRFAKLDSGFTRALQDCFAQYAEWFANSNVHANERCVLQSFRAIFVDTLKHSGGDGVLACMYQTANP
jgi:hypothetical protein